MELAVDFMKVFQDLTQDVDSGGTAHNEIIPYQTMFSNALAVSTKVPVKLGGQRLICRFKALRDFDQQGNLFQTEVDIPWTRRWTFNTGVDVLAPDDPAPANQDVRFINQFRANDRVYGGFNYVF